jgi:hypothetical protein
MRVVVGGEFVVDKFVWVGEYECEFFCVWVSAVYPNNRAGSRFGTRQGSTTHRDRRGRRRKALPGNEETADFKNKMTIAVGGGKLLGTRGGVWVVCAHTERIEGGGRGKLLSW